MLNINKMDIKKYKLILLFHDISDHSESIYTINWSKFKRIIYILNILFKIFNRKIERKILFTFDDGYLSSMKAARYLSRYFNIKSIIFITTNNLNNNGFLKENNLKYYTRNIIIGSHGVSHLSLNNKLSNIKIFEELNDSKNILTDIIKKEITYLSFPNGDYSDKALKISLDLNYKYVFTSKRASNRNKQKNLTFNRFVILKKTPLFLILMGYTGILDNVQQLKKRIWI